MKKIAFMVCAVLFMSPAFVSADTGKTEQLVALYTKLIQVLQQQIILLQQIEAEKVPLSGHATLTITPETGVAPFVMTFILSGANGTEAVDFGDGHSTGSNGCKRNTKGWCDLSAPFFHMYQLPGTYTVTLYDHPTRTTNSVVSKKSVTIKGGTVDN
jgi:hypothetical protein